jgi:hypothetical protein
MNQFDIQKAYTFITTDGDTMYAKIMTVDSGWDYDLYDADYSIIDEGQVDNPEMTVRDVLSDMLAFSDIEIDWNTLKEIEYDEFEETIMQLD